MSCNPTEVSFSVNDLMLQGQRWKNGTRHRLLCLHGWLDNSESFSLLAPLLNECDIVALDMAGHGQSSHRSKHGGYNIWDDHIDIEAVADELGWDTFVLLGHSRGAISGFLFATAMPERLDRLILLDGLFPPNNEMRSAPEQLRAFLTQRSRVMKKQRRRYTTVKEAFESRKMLNSLSEVEALRMVARDMVEVDSPSGSSWVYRHDPRLKGASSVKFKPDQRDEFLSALQVRTLLIYQQDGMIDESILIAALENNPSLEAYAQRGSHHFHMQKGPMQHVAKRISGWLSQTI